MYNKNFKIDDFEFNIEDILKISFIAGEKILKVYEQKFDIIYKKDDSPLTLADKLSHNHIFENLKRYHLPILSEEGKEIDYEIRKNWKLFWMIDPLDGTKEFIKKNGEFTVNIALIYKNSPIFGVVYAPVLKKVYFTDINNSYSAIFDNTGNLKNIEKLPLHIKERNFTVVASKSHLNIDTENFINSLKKEHSDLVFISKGSSLKLCLVAEGEADIYPRLAPTMEWDTAAADSIVQKTGKNVFVYNTNKNLIYNKKDLKNPFFIVK